MVPTCTAWVSVTACYTHCFVPASVSPASFDRSSGLFICSLVCYLTHTSVRKKKKQLSMRLAASLKGAFAHKPPSLSNTICHSRTHNMTVKEKFIPPKKLNKSPTWQKRRTCTHREAETGWHQSKIWRGWTASPSGETCKLKKKKKAVPKYFDTSFTGICKVFTKSRRDAKEKEKRLCGKT